MLNSTQPTSCLVWCLAWKRNGAILSLTTPGPI